MKKLSGEEVKHIARLARIELTEEEIAKFEKELSVTLEFVEKLDEVNTGGVEPMTGGASLQNRVREDRQIEKILEDAQEELLHSLPDKKDSWLKVKSPF